jgi:hypothetical protein
MAVIWQRIWTAETPSMIAPSDQMVAVSPLATPSSMICALSDGRYREAPVEIS